MARTVSKFIAAAIVGSAAAMPQFLEFGAEAFGGSPERSQTGPRNVGAPPPFLEVQAGAIGGGLADALQAKKSSHQGSGPADVFADGHARVRADYDTFAAQARTAAVAGDKMDGDAATKFADAVKQLHGMIQNKANKLGHDLTNIVDEGNTWANDIFEKGNARADDVIEKGNARADDVIEKGDAWVRAAFDKIASERKKEAVPVEKLGLIKDNIRSAPNLQYAFADMKAKGAHIMEKFADHRASKAFDAAVIERRVLSKVQKGWKGLSWSRGGSAAALMLAAAAVSALAVRRARAGQARVPIPVLQDALPLMELSEPMMTAVRIQF